MRRNMVVAAVIGVVLVVGLGVVAGVAAYGRGQPVIVAEPGPGPVGWFENGMEHLTGNAQDGTDRFIAANESPEGDAFYRDVVAPVIIFGGAALGLVVIGWLVVDHRRRQRGVDAQRPPV